MFEWDLDPNNNSSLLNNLAAGNYPVKITDNFGCFIMDTLTVIAETIVCDLNIPSGFSPNGDGVNDVWVIRGIEAYPEAYIEVFNRWGDIVFRSQGYQSPWNGDSQQGALSSAAYYYTIVLAEGKSITGVISIIK